MMSNSSDQWNSAEYSSNGHHRSSCAVVDSPSKARRRSRASRKAPTTLLNANTTNFRDLVQQFTGFQAASGSAMPFGGSQRGPVNLSFGQDIEYQNKELAAHKSTVMLPFSSNENENYHYQLYNPIMSQQQQQQKSVVYPFESSSCSTGTHVSKPTSSTTLITDHGCSDDHFMDMEIQDHHHHGILMDDEDFSLHQLAFEFSTSNHNGAYFP